MIAADLVLRGGKIVTVDDAFNIVSALAVRGDRIVATGSDAEVKPLIGPQTSRSRSQRPHGHPRPS